MCVSLPNSSIRARCSESTALSKAAQERAWCSETLSDARITDPICGTLATGMALARKILETIHFGLEYCERAPSVEEGCEWGDQNERTERTGDEA